MELRSKLLDQIKEEDWNSSLDLIKDELNNCIIKGDSKIQEFGEYRLKLYYQLSGDFRDNELKLHFDRTLNEAKNELLHLQKSIVAYCFYISREKPIEIFCENLCLQSVLNEISIPKLIEDINKILPELWFYDSIISMGILLREKTKDFDVPYIEDVEQSYIKKLETKVKHLKAESFDSNYTLTNFGIGLSYPAISPFYDLLIESDLFSKKDITLSDFYFIHSLKNKNKKLPLDIKRANITIEHLGYIVFRLRPTKNSDDRILFDNWLKNHWELISGNGNPLETENFIKKYVNPYESKVMNDIKFKNLSHVMDNIVEYNDTIPMKS